MAQESQALQTDPREEYEQTVFSKAAKSLMLLSQISESGSAEVVEEAANMIGELLVSIALNTAKAQELRAALKTLERRSFELSVDTLLGLAEKKGHEGDEKERNELIAKARQHFAKAIGYGANDAFRHAAERRIEVAQLTSADGVDERTKSASARKLDQRGEGGKPPDGCPERRRAIRYCDPVLEVILFGHAYQTVNWSARGVLVEDVPFEQIAVRDRVKVMVRCSEIPDYPAQRLTAQVVRIDKERSAVAFDFGEMSPAILDLMHALKHAGIKPEP